MSFGCLGVKDMCIFHNNLTIKPCLFFFYVHVFLIESHLKIKFFSQVFYLGANFASSCY
jgi:hypothetical protein